MQVPPESVALAIRESLGRLREERNAFATALAAAGVSSLMGYGPGLSLAVFAVALVFVGD